MSFRFFEMCGIAAIFAYHSDAPGVDAGELLAIRDCMIARGPDGAGEWYGVDRRVGLAHRRLSIMDLSSAGAQPMLLPEHQLAIVFNGEIYNYRELRADLEQRGHKFRSTGDTEVLLHLYAERGAAMVDVLRGMYAFAIWDGVKRGLFAARDPHGIKPLYLADDGKTLRVASQVKALLAGRKVDTASDPAGHVGFFLWGHIPEPYTLYRGIRSLPAGTTLWAGQNGERQERTFCSITEILRSAEPSVRRSKSEDGRMATPTASALSTPSSQPLSTRNPQPSAGLSAFSFQLSAFLRDSIAHHLIADVPVGVFLSSGMDSTTLAALAAQQGGLLRTVTLGFEEFKGTRDDETPLAETVAARYGAQHQTIWVRRDDFRAHVERLFQAMDQPTTDGVNTYFVSLAAARASLKVALSGLGGDELFGGYPGFAQIPRMAGALKFLPPGNGLGRAFRVLSAPLVKLFTSPKYAGLLEYGGSYGGAYLLRRGMFMPWELPEILDPEIVRQGWSELQPLVRLDETVNGLRSPRTRVSCLETCWYMRNQLLRDSDWAGMAHSLEIRVPLVDVTLLRALAPLLASATPPTKLDLASTPISHLPSSVLNRPKTGFQVPVREWLLEEKLKAESGKQKCENASQQSAARGLRGWAKVVYGRFPGACPLVPRTRRRPDRARRPVPSPHHSDQVQLLTSDLRPLVSPLRARQRILVFRIGQLGDTIIALPAMWAIRKHFPDASLTLLCDRHPGKRHVLAADLLKSAGIFERFKSYDVDATTTGKLLRAQRMLRLLFKLRHRHFDTMVYLAPSTRTPAQVERDRKFFSLAGIKKIIGANGFPELSGKTPGLPLRATPSEADLLLARLAADGVTVPEAGQGSLELKLGDAENREVESWLASQRAKDGGQKAEGSRPISSAREMALPDSPGRPWIGIGPGSKMPAKRWPEERFGQVVMELIERHDVWPVVFGGSEDAAIGERLLRAWGRGHNAAGALSVRGAAAALKRCVMYLGNDTGTMHLAAAVQTPCVAVFSAREWPGMWYPYGVENRVLRSQIDCEGCGLIECVERHNECLNRIQAGDVLAACEDILNKESGKQKLTNEMVKC